METVIDPPERSDPPDPPDPPDPSLLCSDCNETEEDCACLQCSYYDCGVHRTVYHKTSDVCRRCNSCDDHCHCSHCVGCDEMVDSVCNDCEHCSDCCDCIRCDNCNDVCDSTCDRCDRCDSCCHCSDDDDEDTSRVRFSKYDLTFHSARLNEREINRSMRFIAAEIEVDNIRGDTHSFEAVCKRWQASIVEDGSLASSGFEINTAPANGDKFVEQINEICKSLSAAGAGVDDTCGLHVHVDARDFSYYDVRRLIIAYAQIEDALFSMAPKSRRSSRWCAPCGKQYTDAVENGKIDNKILRKNVFRGVYGEDPDRSNKGLRKQSKPGARYRAMNLHSWLFRGTIECRLFEGTIDKDEIVSWGRLWATILDWVVARTDEQAVTDLAARRTSHTKLEAMMGGDKALLSFIERRIKRCK